MKNLYIIMLLSCLGGLSAHAQDVYIPDSNFKAYLLSDSSINTNYDTAISVAEAHAYGAPLDVHGLGIKDLTGIEAFINIYQLDCSNNLLTSLNVSSNTALTSLSCLYNSLTSLNVSSNILIDFIDCTGNNLTNLNVSSNTKLQTFWCDNNNLTSLDLSVNTVLSQMNCEYNYLTSLDLSSDTALITLYCDNNSLTSLNVKNGNNLNMPGFWFIADNNPNLACIEVDSVAYSVANWTQVDPWTSFSTNCSNDHCSGFFSLEADTTLPHHYIATNYAFGEGPLKYDWSWGDVSHDTIPYPSHTYTDSGFYTICLTITDSSGCISTYCDSSFHIMRTTNYMVYINVVNPLITGTQVLNSPTTQVTIYPNPFTSQTTIAFSQEQKNTTIIITDLLGKEIKTINFSGKQLTIDKGEMSNGIYFVQIMDAKGIAVNKKIVVQ